MSCGSRALQLGIVVVISQLSAAQAQAQVAAQGAAQVQVQEAAPVQAAAQVQVQGQVQSPLPEVELPEPPPLTNLPRELPYLNDRVRTRFKIGNILYGFGTATGSLAAAAVGAGGVLTLVLKPDPSNPSDPNAIIGPAVAVSGQASNILGLGLLASGCIVQHSALTMVKRDPGKGALVTGLVFGVLGLLSTLTGFVMTNPAVLNSLDRATGGKGGIILGSISFGGSGLLTTGISTLIGDGARNRKAYARMSQYQFSAGAPVGPFPGGVPPEIPEGAPSAPIPGGYTAEQLNPELKKK